MKTKSIRYLFCLLLLNSCQTEHILLDCHEGIVVDKSTNQAIANVKIYTDSTAFDYFEPYVTEEDGYFFTPSLVIPYYDKGYSWRRGMSYTLIFSAPGYQSDTLDLRSVPNESNWDNLDTINLGKIILTPIEEQ